MLQAKGIIPTEGGKRSDLEDEDNEIHVSPSQGVIDLESNDEDDRVRSLLPSRMKINLFLMTFHSLRPQIALNAP
jgi:hypothetical protein